MSVGKTIEITSGSNKSFEDAVERGIKKMAETIQHIEGAWIKEQKVVVKDGTVVEFRVTMKVTFIVE